MLCKGDVSAGGGMFLFAPARVGCRTLHTITTLTEEAFGDPQTPAVVGLSLFVGRRQRVSGRDYHYLRLDEVS